MANQQYDFSTAFHLLRNGSRIRRAGWPGWLIHVGPTSIPAHSTGKPASVAKEFAAIVGQDTEVSTTDSIARWIPALNRLHTGWLPDSEELFAMDWEVVV
jgi:hypothetical protein